MFRSIQFHASALALLLLLADPARAAQTLRVYTWSDYVDPELVSEFEAQFDAHVMFAYFASDGLRDKANMAALEYVSDNYLSNTAIFPGQEKMDMLEFV